MLPDLRLIIPTILATVALVVLGLGALAPRATLPGSAETPRVEQSFAELGLRPAATTPDAATKHAPAPPGLDGAGSAAQSPEQAAGSSVDASAPTPSVATALPTQPAGVPAIEAQRDPTAREGDPIITGAVATNPTAPPESAAGPDLSADGNPAKVDAAVAPELPGASVAAASQAAAAAAGEATAALPAAEAAPPQPASATEPAAAAPSPEQSVAAGNAGKSKPAISERISSPSAAARTETPLPAEIPPADAIPPNMEEAPASTGSVPKAAVAAIATGKHSAAKASALRKPTKAAGKPKPVRNAKAGKPRLSKAVHRARPSAPATVTYPAATSPFGYSPFGNNNNPFIGFGPNPAFRSTPMPARPSISARAGHLPASSAQDMNR